MEAGTRRKMALSPDLVARCFRPETDLPGKFVRAEESEIAEAADRLLRAREGPLWVFAYGSLIWKPCFEPAEVLRGTAVGWHRAFNIRIDRFRGSPDRPGLMMALARGGRCSGLLMRAEDGKEPEVLAALLRREVPMREFLDMARWITVEHGAGKTRAMVFWAGPFPSVDAIALDLEDAARMIAAACGPAGSCAEYVYETVAALERHGIADRNLWRLQELVAGEIQSWPIDEYSRSALH
jgi:glutathione-specific gamma-glutamylcyclotransferase